MDCIVFSQNESTSQLSQFVDQKFGWHSIQLDSADDAVARLQQKNLQTVFVDLTPEFYCDETHRFMQRIADELTAINLIAVSDGNIPLAVASLIDRLACDHIEFPSDSQQIEETVGVLKEHAQSGKVRSIPKEYVCQAHGVVFRTYTDSLRDLLEKLVQVAKYDVSLLLTGATGSGKTTLARLVHDLSPRRDRPFQHLACGALPSDLIESELFGHARGAFTGADRTKIGRFEAAGSGTILLDEVDSLCEKGQAKLLKVIETGEYEMVGSTESCKLKARVIVASNRNLNDLVEKSEFREDLFYRVSVVEFYLPALKDRRCDIIPFATSFIEEFSKQYDIEIRAVHVDFLEALKQYDWPGNIRELRHQIQRAVLFCKNGQLTVNDLLAKIIQSQFEVDVERKTQHKTDAGMVSDAQRWKLSEHVSTNEKKVVQAAVRAAGYNMTAAAQSLGISRGGLYKKLHRLGLPTTKPQNGTAAELLQ